MSRVALVTGATDGIGEQTAFELLKAGFTVIVHGRSAAKVERVKASLSKQVPGAKIESAVGDFAKLSEVRALAAEVKSRFPVLNVLINNAGIYAKTREETADGFELTFQVNYLAPFLLTRELLPLLEKSAPARIVNVSSMVHMSGHIDFEDLQLKRSYSGFAAYAASKLGNVFFTQQLAERLDANKVTANSLHPGVIGTKLLTQGFGGMGGASVENGARTSVFLATSPEVEGVSGRYFSDSREAPASRAVHDARTQKKLWEISEQLVEQAGKRE
jgi:NAD(P)-dependent dehydrogenase (short-subunit alcohol dehydrogenase family)